MELLVIITMWILLLIAYLHITPVRSTAKLQYSREFLLQGHQPYYVRYPVDFIKSQHFLNDSGFMENAAGNNDESKTWKPRKRGKKGGVRQRLRKQRLRRIPLPTIVMANVQSLRNKIDELQATVHVHHAYREACILAFTETWLKAQDIDSVLTIHGFGTPLRTDRDSVITGKSQGGGVFLYINERW